MGLLVGDIEHYLYRHDDTGLNLRLGDPNGSHIFGSLRHQESSFAIGCPSGALRLTVGNESTPETAVLCNNNGNVELYHNNSKRLETTDAGTYVTGTCACSSDVALKEDITPLSNALTNLKQLTGYSYKFKDNGFKSLGLTAQEVEKVYPDLITGEEGKKGLNYDGLIAPLLEAVKELSTEVETLKTKVAALESA